MTVRRAAVLAAAALTAAACAGGTAPAKPTGPPSPTPQNLGVVVDEAPSLRPLPLGREPLWTQDTKGAVKYISAAALHGDAAVIVGGLRKKETRLVVADAATGKVRWSVGEFGPLRGGGGAVWLDMAYGRSRTPQIVGKGADWGILANYYLTGCRHPTGLCPLGSGPSDETGVALLSGRDGSVRWRLPLVPARTGRAARAANRLRGVLETSGGKIALATVAPSPTGGFGDVRLVAVDVATGRRLWTRSGVQPVMVSGDLVLGRVAGGTGGSRLDLGGGSVVALDAATGRTRWEPSPRMPASLPALAAGNLPMVREVKDGRLGPPLVLDPGTGREIARLPEFVTGCQTDGVSLIACEYSDLRQRRLVTIRLDGREVRVARRELPDATLAAVWRGHVFLDDRHDRGYEVDRSANVLADDLPGEPVALSEGYAIFQGRYSEMPGYSVHRVG
ncbi:PQQ-like beta-propeller repeat protein [Sphaerisporangium corydalis]|uniref:PQQ-like beta-propeller repeat protein n=1 Tax=Sphaerisporangium corydalis TaxID=1441875 RepID=A0ABV9EGT1_9ACTN|nr:PQQ-like beta-propeller repeat protein [Sphaerisporangium corydalis]